MGVRHGDGDTRKCVHGVGTRGREMRDLRMRDVKDVKYRTQGPGAPNEDIVQNHLT